MKFILPYLLLVTFSGMPYQPDAPDNDWTALAGSPYDGVAMRLVEAYDTERPDYGQMDEVMARVRKDTGKDPLPWIFLNRMMGLNLESCMNKSVAEPAKGRFLKINGLDLDNKAGGRDEFLTNWETYFSLARKHGAPGVVIDLEAYNDYDVQRVPLLAKKLGKTPDETIKALKKLGAEMADIAAAEHPDAWVWTLFAWLGSEDYRQSGYGNSVGYICLGMLDRCVEKKYNLKLIPGGEAWVKYCSSGVDDLKAKIARRDAAYEKYVNKYPLNMDMGGTIAPWDDGAKRSSWLMQGACALCDAKKIGDFEPYFKELARNYNYIWIYAAVVAPYNPFNKEHAARFNPALAKSFGKEEPKIDREDNPVLPPADR